MNKKEMIYRTPLIIRFCHIVLVILFILTALSGLSFFFPSIKIFGMALGTPQLSRLLHPFIGCIVFTLLMFMFVNLVHHNIPDKDDFKWIKEAPKMMFGVEPSAPVGKYNAGQKFLFWCIMSLITVLLVTGLIMWRRYFADYFAIDIVRIAIVLHSVAAIALIILIIGHAYMAMLVKGSIKGMITGYVSRAWALKNHSKWYHKEMKKRYEKEERSES